LWTESQSGWAGYPRPRAHPPRLVAPVTHLDIAHRRADQRAGTPASGADPVHRVRVPVTRPLPAGEPRRPGRRPRARTALLDRRSAAALRAITSRATCGRRSYPARPTPPAAP